MNINQHFHLSESYKQVITVIKNEWEKGETGREEKKEKEEGCRKNENYKDSIKEISCGSKLYLGNS
jgi:hypothetical protein